VGTAERDKSMPKTAGVKARSLDAVSDGAFAVTRMNAQDHEAQHAKLRPSTQQRDIVPYQSTLSGESRSSSPGKSNVRNAHLLTSFSQSLKARYEIAQRFCLTFLLHLPIVCWFVLVRSSPPAVVSRLKVRRARRIPHACGHQSGPAQF